MSFIMKKKKYKFQVDLEIEELANVPFVSGLLFSKVRLLDSGNFCECTDRAEVVGHKVHWKACFKFECRPVSNATSGILDPCMCRVSVRKETKGGKSYQKLGFANINLTQFAGTGRTTLRSLLNGYDTKHRREDNSTLKISVHLTMLKGDPCFKVAPSISDQLFYDKALHVGNRVQNPNEGESRSSPGAGLTTIEWNIGPVDFTDKLRNDDILCHTEMEKLSALGHSRSASTVSNQSKTSGQINMRPLLHSRQPSTDSFQIWTSTCSSDLGLIGTKRTRQLKLDDNTLDVVDGVLRTAGFSTVEEAGQVVSKNCATFLQTIQSASSSESSAGKSVHQ